MSAGRMIEGREIHADRREDVDVVIVGSGAGGAVAAETLARAGRSVLVLEEGGWYTAKDFRHREEHAFDTIEGERGFGVTKDYSVNLTYCKTIGGSTVHFWADMVKLPEDRLASWRKRFGLDELTGEALAPHYEFLREKLNILPATERQANRNNALFKKGAEALGYKVDTVHHARRDCIGCGFCMLGCAFDRKQSMLITFVPWAIDAGATVCADTRVDAITHENGKATGVIASVLDRATRRAKARLTVKAKVVYVAAGGFESAALLLRSRLPDPGKQTGLHFQCNPSPMAFGVFDEPVEQHVNIPAAYAVMDLRPKVVDAKGRYVTGGYYPTPTQIHLGTFAAIVNGFGAEHRRWMEAWPFLGGTYNMLDDEVPGRITVDSHGRRVIDYSLKGVDVEKTRDFLRVSAKLLFAAGAKEVWLPDNHGTRIPGPEKIEEKIGALSLAPGSILLAAPHPAGTCRMSADPATGVVDPHGEHHGVKRLFVSDGSRYPTGPSVEPSYGIMAISRMTATRIAETWDRVAA